MGFRCEKRPTKVYTRLGNASANERKGAIPLGNEHMPASGIAGKDRPNDAATD